MDDLQQELDRVQQRARRYWFEDGLAEIVSSIVFLGVALYSLAEFALRPRPLGGLLNVLFPALIVALGFAARVIVRRAKDRYVHPRTGYVAFRKPSGGHRWSTGGLAFVLSLLFALLAARTPLIRNWIPALVGLVFGLAFLWVGRKSGLARFPVEGLLCALLGLGISLLQLDESLASALLFAGVAAILVIGGLAGLVTYLRHSARRGNV